MTRVNKTKWVLSQLIAGKIVTPMSALKGVSLFRLSGVIFVLRNDGWDIRTTIARNPDGTVYAKYWLHGCHKPTTNKKAKR